MVEPALPAEFIDRDLPCIGCGYNLRTLAADARCPECNRPVAATVQRDLAFADVRWLKHMRLGAWLLIGYLGTPLASVLLMLTGGALMPFVGPQTNPAIVKVIPVVVGILLCIKLAGVIFITTRGRSMPWPAGAAALSWTARVLAIVALLAQASRFMSLNRQVLPLWVEIALSASPLIVYLLIALRLRFLTGLLERTKLRNATGLFMLALPVSILLPGSFYLMIAIWIAAIALLFLYSRLFSSLIARQRAAEPATP